MNNLEFPQQENLLAQEAEIYEKLWRVNAYIDCYNCITKYNYLHMAGRQKESLETYAMETADVSNEIAMFGKYEGPEKVLELYEQGHKEGVDMEEMNRGLFMEKLISTPVFEVAGDGKTVKSVWSITGHNLDLADDRETGECAWVSMTPATEFLYEKEKAWKIWHNQVFPSYVSAFDRCWTEAKPRGYGVYEDEMDDNVHSKPDENGYSVLEHANAGHSFFQEYRPGMVMQYWPQPPAPYESYAGTQSVLGSPPADADL